MLAKATSWAGIILCGGFRCPGGPVEGPVPPKALPGVPAQGSSPSWPGTEEDHSQGLVVCSPRRPQPRQHQERVERPPKATGTQGGADRLPAPPITHQDPEGGGGRDEGARAADSGFPQTSLRNIWQTCPQPRSCRKRLLPSRLHARWAPQVGFLRNLWGRPEYFGADLWGTSSTTCEGGQMFPLLRIASPAAAPRAGRPPPPPSSSPLTSSPLPTFHQGHPGARPRGKGPFRPAPSKAQMWITAAPAISPRAFADQ